MAKLYIRKGSGNWWASYPNPIGGQTVRRSTQIPCQQGLKDKAQLKANQMELAEWEQWRPGAQRDDYLYDEMMVLFIQDRKPGEGHFNNIKQLTPYFTGCKLTDIGAAQISGYKRHRAHVSDGTLRRELSVLSSAFSHVRVQYDWKVDNPVTGRLPKKSPSRLRWLRPEEAGKAVSMAYDDLQDFMVLGLSTGMRKGELAKMDASRCDFRNRVFHLAPMDQKNGRHDTIPMSRVAYEIASRRAKSGGRLFPWAYPKKGFKGACERAGIEGATIHTLRHTFASWMIQRGVPIREVQDLMRHASITETEKYAHLAPRAEAHYLHSAVYRPGQGLEIIDNILINHVLSGTKMVGTEGFEPTTPTPPVELSLVSLG